jgi:hypothetical protein
MCSVYLAKFEQYYTASDGRMSNELEGTWKDAVMDSYRIISWEVAGGVYCRNNATSGLDYAIS